MQKGGSNRGDIEKGGEEKTRSSTFKKVTNFGTGGGEKGRRRRWRL